MHGAAAGTDPADRIAAAIPPPVRELLRTLWANGHAAYVVGGALRDVVAGRDDHDWDLATSAPPEETASLFDDAVYENRFGTVAVRRPLRTSNTSLDLNSELNCRRGAMAALLS